MADSAKRQKISDDTVGVKIGEGGLLATTGNSGENATTMELSGLSAESKKRAADLKRSLEAKRRARTIAVPTSDHDVRRRLRQLGEPITYFGEGPANRRERLRTLLAQIAVEAASGISNEMTKKLEEFEAEGGELFPAIDARKTKKAFDTDGTAALLNARVEILQYSIPRARNRLLAAKRKRANITKEIMAEIDKAYADRALELKTFTNRSSQIGGARPISGCDFSASCDRLVTASWSGVCKLWSVPDSTLLGTLKGHEDRVSDVRFHPHAGVSLGGSLSLATAGVDGTLRFWSTKQLEESAKEDKKMDMEGEEEIKVPSIRPLTTLKGHTDRLSRIEFHPSGQYIASTSYDATWRLWDLTLQKELLSQDGHAVGLYGLAFQGDGSVLATGDVGGVCILWDLRTGKSICTLDGHVDNILTMDFSSNGHQFASGSCDNSLRIWDLRKRKGIYTILAHSKLISNVRYSPKGSDFLLSSSYDETVKIWSARDYQLIKTLKGHEGRVMRVEMSDDGQMVASTSFDRTWKLWMKDED
ncbi:hypothetical protein AAMO2058_000826200 [Amorphochlora amoebiformis]|uniref:Pre-mRNA processing factor 4 (PRP4)-like domain-containing protein n=1 Tax=Amorphochlora amoebiformis TaxID=1561963 RepID=A0A7S0GPW7_9EUKA|mmetsp:Transcript_10982/g.17342  ORF Transcript_10982/g.17342 Transcript_10982/m.17342 type:complete len:532 (+) Transcript_10982:73-1668(+)